MRERGELNFQHWQANLQRSAFTTVGAGFLIMPPTYAQALDQIQQLQQENQALRERFSQLQENFEQERSAHDSDLNELQKQHIRCIKSEIELTRLREALKKIERGESAQPGLAHEFYGHAMRIAREALAPQEGKQE